MWDFVQQHDRKEFEAVHPIAFHVHGPGHFFMVKKPVNGLDDIKGAKLEIFQDLGHNPMEEDPKATAAAVAAFLATTPPRRLPRLPPPR